MEQHACSVRCKLPQNGAHHDHLAAASRDGGMVVQVVPDARGEVRRGADGALGQDGGHHQRISQHPLLVNVVGGRVTRETEEERAYDAAAKGVRIVKGGVQVWHHSQPPCEDLPGHSAHCRGPAVVAQVAPISMQKA